MRSISVELSLEIDENRTTRGEFLIGDGLLKLCVAFVHFRGERSSVEFFTRLSKLVNKGELKIAEAFDGGIASGLKSPVLSCPYWERQMPARFMTIMTSAKPRSGGTRLNGGRISERQRLEPSHESLARNFPGR